MKAVIFSCSLKNGKWSMTKAWSNLMAKRLSKQGIQSHIVNLRDYDYEASTSIDQLHEQMQHVYDSDLIIFSSPANINHPSFSMANLLSRFVHAHEKATASGVDIFANKVWEYCNLNGSHHVDKRKFKYYQDWDNHHGYILETLPFIQHLGCKTANVAVRGPKWLEGPTYKTMEHNAEVIKVCDEMVDKFVERSKSNTTKLPSCSLEKFLDFFKSDDVKAFGRGMTIAEENINDNSVEEHIDYVKQTVENNSHRAMVFMCMKERCSRLGHYDLAEKYYIEQFQIISNDQQYDKMCSGNYRPNGY